MPSDRRPCCYLDIFIIYTVMIPYLTFHTPPPSRPSRLISCIFPHASTPVAGPAARGFGAQKESKGGEFHMTHFYSRYVRI